MKRICELAFFVLFFQLAYAQTLMNNELATLQNALNENSISSFVVLRMTDDVMTRIAVSPQALRKVDSSTRKYTIEMNHSRSALLTDWIKQARFTRSELTPDCRWGLLFMDRTGKEVASIFSDKFGMAGNVNGHNFDFPRGAHLLETIHALFGSEVH